MEHIHVKEIVNSLQILGIIRSYQEEKPWENPTNVETATC